MTSSGAHEYVATAELEKVQISFYKQICILISCFSDCQDVYPVACEDWGKGGECSKNPIWMNAHCTRTCNQCSGE